MSNPNRLGGIIHTYQKYDPVRFPSPTQPPPDLVSPAFEHLLQYGDLSELTEEELARAVRIDPSQIANLGPSLDHLRQLLLERKRKILATYETQAVQKEADQAYRSKAGEVAPPEKLRTKFDQAVRQEQLRDLEELFFYAGDDRSKFARSLVQLVQKLAEKYQVDELAGKYEFTGRRRMTVPEALAIKEELEEIDRLLKQLEEARKNAQIGIIDLEELSKFVEQADVEQLRDLQRQIDEYMRELAREQGIDGDPRRGFQMTPKAYRLFQ